MFEERYSVSFLVPGDAEAPVLALSAPISFWGGIDLKSGRICDINHPQNGKLISHKILLLPSTKGSTAGPGALLEFLCSPNAPAAILTNGSDMVVALACRVKSLLRTTDNPMGMMTDEDFRQCAGRSNCARGILSAQGLTLLSRA